jgi:hypothetical protein
LAKHLGVDFRAETDQEERLEGKSPSRGYGCYLAQLAVEVHLVEVADEPVAHLVEGPVRTGTPRTSFEYGNCQCLS